VSKYEPPFKWGTSRSSFLGKFTESGQWNGTLATLELTKYGERTYMGNLLSFDETAQKLRVSKAQLSKIINGKVRGLPRLKIARFGRRVVIREEVVDEWVQEVELCNEVR
jgi:hypothetical protein